MKKDPATSRVKPDLITLLHHIDYVNLNLGT